MRRYVATGLIVIVAALGTVYVVGATSELPPPVPIVPVPDDVQGDEPSDPAEIVFPTEGEIVGLNDGGEYPVTWTRVEDTLFYHVQIWSAQTRLDGLTYTSEYTEFIYGTDDSQDFQLRDPNIMVNLGLLVPRSWHRVVVTPYGPSQRLLNEYETRFNLPTGLGIDSGYYNQLAPASTPRYFYLANVSEDAAVPATVPVDDFPPLSTEMIMAPGPQVLESRLTLEPLCSNYPEGARSWRVLNPNSVAVEAFFEVEESNQTGQLTIPAGNALVPGELTFDTATVGDAHSNPQTTTIYIDDVPVVTGSNPFDMCVY